MTFRPTLALLLLAACSSGEDAGDNAAAPAPAPTFTGAPPVTPQQQVPRVTATPRWLDNAPSDTNAVYQPAMPSGRP